jgi:hypothetical protein
MSIIVFDTFFLYISFYCKVLNISFNNVTHFDSSFLSSNPYCLQTLQILDVSNNYLDEIPSLVLTKITDLRQLYLQTNLLTSLDLSLIVLVSTSVDLSNNQISRLTNNANVNISSYGYARYTYIDLTNNNPIIDLTDAIYEMYGSCHEIQQIFNSSITSVIPLLTIGLSTINFDISKINCTCNQYYIQQSLVSTFGNNLSSSDPLSNATCTDGTLFYKNNRSTSCSASSVIFTNTIPRLCKINPDGGSLTLVNTTVNITTGVS